MKSSPVALRSPSIFVRLAGWCRCSATLAFELLAGLVGALLQLVLQLLLLLFEDLRIGGRAFIGLGEQGQRKADGSAGQVDRLDSQHLAVLELADQIGGRLMQPLRSR
jgi:hypothetical protein